MASITIHNLPEETKESLRKLADQSGLTLEDYVRKILNEVSCVDHKNQKNLQETSGTYCGPDNSVDLKLPERRSILQQIENIPAVKKFLEICGFLFATTFIYYTFIFWLLLILIAILITITYPIHQVSANGNLSSIARHLMFYMTCIYPLYIIGIFYIRHFFTDKPEENNFT